jgi:hypothetical protein
VKNLGGYKSEIFRSAQNDKMAWHKARMLAGVGAGFKPARRKAAGGSDTQFKDSCGLSGLYLWEDGL